MKKLFIVILLLSLLTGVNAYTKKSLVERFTNCSCGPCATINNAWYNATLADILTQESVTHIVYNVDWPSPTDPMHLLNSADNNNRRGYYGVTSVPWIEINGTNVSTSESAFNTAVTNGNLEFAPFKLNITGEKFSNNLIDVKVVITRDPSDVSTFGNVKLRIAIIQDLVQYASPPGSNGESSFHQVCRKMLPDGNGSSFDIPAPGDSVEITQFYIPSEDFLDDVDFEDLKIVAFLQDDDSKEVYQSAQTDVVLANRVNAAFKVEENLGASPFEVQFLDYSTSTDSTTITSWAWDFDNDGSIDSEDQQPIWTFSEEQSSTITLTVSDGIEEHTRIIENYITVMGNQSNILVVNGIDYNTYLAEMDDFYNNSACFGDNQVDVWDLFGDQGFDYASNSNIQQVALLSRTIPNSILNLYDKVIWIGNSYGGDEAFYDPDQVLAYIEQGGNFLLATREGSEFFNTALRNYCGISSFQTLQTITQLYALDDNLVDMAVTSTHSRVDLIQLSAGSTATPIFDNDQNATRIDGFMMHKEGNGAFIHIAGRPYRFNNAASAQNYDFIIYNWLTAIPTGIEDNSVLGNATTFVLNQNFPNPFNPTTNIAFNLTKSSQVSLVVYNILGEKVKTLVNQKMVAGPQSITWDATNDHGAKVSSGIYFYKLKSAEGQLQKKMLLIK